MLYKSPWSQCANHRRLQKQKSYNATSNSSVWNPEQRKMGATSAVSSCRLLQGRSYLVDTHCGASCHACVCWNDVYIHVCCLLLFLSKKLSGIMSCGITPL